MFDLIDNWHCCPILSSDFDLDQIHHLNLLLDFDSDGSIQFGMSNCLSLVCIPNGNNMRKGKRKCSNISLFEWMSLENKIKIGKRNDTEKGRISRENKVTPRKPQPKFLVKHILFVTNLHNNR